METFHRLRIIATLHVFVLDNLEAEDFTIFLVSTSQERSLTVPKVEILIAGLITIVI